MKKSIPVEVIEMREQDPRRDAGGEEARPEDRADPLRDRPGRMVEREVGADLHSPGSTGGVALPSGARSGSTGGAAGVGGVFAAASRRAASEIDQT